MSDRYAFSPEEGFFVDMHNPDPDDPELGEELLVQDVLLLLNRLPKLEAVIEAGNFDTMGRVLFEEEFWKLLEELEES